MTQTVTQAPTTRATRLTAASLTGQDSAVLPTITALPTLDDTYALLVTAARSACSLRLRFGSQMPWGASKKAALHAVANAHSDGIASLLYKQHEKNWAKLVKAERIHLMRRTVDGCFYLPDFLLTQNDDDWTVNQEAVGHFVAAGATPSAKGEPVS